MSCDPENPLNMRQLGEGGPFVLPPTNCSPRRVDFLKRSNAILGFYATVALYSEKGRENLEAAEKNGQLTPETAIRVKLDPGGFVMQTNYRLLKKQFARAGAQLTNQVFLMIYGNFEAYVLDVVADGFKATSCANPEEQAVQIIMGTSWRGKFDRVMQKLGVELGKSKLNSKFHDLDLGFLGDKCDDPIDFLNRMADLRHRLVHSTGRADAALVTRYPNSNLAVGDIIHLPFGLPQGIHFYFVLLTEILDEAFIAKFNWPHSLVDPEKLVE